VAYFESESGLRPAEKGWQRRFSRSREEASLGTRPYEAFAPQTKLIFPANEDTLKPISDTKSRDQPNEGLVMWWAFIVSMVLVYPAVEVVEEWRLRETAHRNAEACSLPPTNGM
jgi:hypothetical protein